MPFPALQFPLYGLANEVRPALAFGQGGVYPVEGSGREPGDHVLRPKFFASHAIISHMSY
jgi:hypothetical protein